MLNDFDAIATVCVRDIKAAKKFYESTLGLQPESGSEEDAIIFKSGNSRLMVYQSENAGTNRATAVNWFVGGDLEGIVQDLRGKGVPFEHYDMPGMTRNGDIHSWGPMQMAWCKDPDGNILALMNTPS